MPDPGFRWRFRANVVTAMQQLRRAEYSCVSTNSLNSSRQIESWHPNELGELLDNYSLQDRDHQSRVLILEVFISTAV